MKYLLYILPLAFLSFAQKATGQSPTTDQDIAVTTAFHSNYEASLFEKVRAGVPVNPIHLLMAASPEANIEKGNEIVLELEGLLRYLETKKNKFKNHDKFLRCAFNKVQQKYLRKFEYQTDFYNLIDGKEFNCLSGTALYAYIFDQLGYSSIIKETDYHIYLLIYHEGREYLIESTDKIGGVVLKQDEIEQRKKQYTTGSGALLEGQNGISSQQSQYHFSVKVDNQVNIQHAAGLQYYNLAIQHFNDLQYDKALQDIDKAILLYPSQRLYEFKLLTLHTLLRGKSIDEKAKEYYKKIYASFLRSSGYLAKN